MATNAMTSETATAWSRESIRKGGSELEHEERAREAAEIQFRFVDRQVGQLGRIEELGRMEIANVTAHTNVPAEERDHACADVPSDLALVAVFADVLDRTSRCRWTVGHGQFARSG